MTIFLNRSLLITRPLQESLVFSSQLHNFNKSIGTICSPLFEIENIYIKKNLSTVTSLIITSSNAIRSLKKSKIIFKGPLFCVGDSTGILAKKEGFRSVSSNGGLNHLLRLIERSTSNDMEKLVYFRGSEVTGDLVGSLRKNNYNIDEVICYKKTPTKLPLQIIEAIHSKSILGATFFSKQTVNLFLSNVRYIPDGFIAFCISEEVSQTVLATWPKSKFDVRIAAFPTRQEMCKLVVAAPEFAE